MSVIINDLYNINIITTTSNEFFDLSKLISYLNSNRP